MSPKHWLTAAWVVVWFLTVIAQAVAGVSPWTQAFVVVAFWTGAFTAQAQTHRHRDDMDRGKPWYGERA